ncbi:MAG: hypothetical protein WCC90_00790 [Methylocella sp.]
MYLLEKLAINRKITAFFADGSQKMNLGIAAVVDLLKGTEKVPVQLAPVQRASRLLKDLAESAGRTVEQAEEGVFLVQPVVEPVAEVVAQSVAEAIAEPVEAIAQPEVTVVKTSHKYATLGTIFFRGSIAGQIKSVFKTPPGASHIISGMPPDSCRRRVMPTRIIATREWVRMPIKSNKSASPKCFEEDVPLSAARTRRPAKSQTPRLVTL